MEMRDRLADLAPAIRIAGAGAATRATRSVAAPGAAGSRERPSRGADVGRSPDSFERLHCWCCRRERVAGYWQRAHRQPNASVPQRTNGARPGSAKVTAPPLPPKQAPEAPIRLLKDPLPQISTISVSDRRRFAIGDGRV